LFGWKKLLVADKRSAADGFLQLLNHPAAAL
jgi:hypothetical protein